MKKGSKKREKEEHLRDNEKDHSSAQSELYNRRMLPLERGFM
jgi:hypothetical protein